MPDADIEEPQYRGPRGRIHWPEWSPGCWHQRVETCCTVCFVRLIVAGVWYAIRARLFGGGR